MVPVSPSTPGISSVTWSNFIQRTISCSSAVLCAAAGNYLFLPAALKPNRNFTPCPPSSSTFFGIPSIFIQSRKSSVRSMSFTPLTGLNRPAVSPKSPLSTTSFLSNTPIPPKGESGSPTGNALPGSTKRAPSFWPSANRPKLT